MKILDVKISDLRPYKHNPRINTNAVGPLAKSIEQFGFRVPIVIDKGYTIVCGHTRLKAAKLLGLKSVPCIMISDLSPDQVKAFRLADNQVASIAEWDPVGLRFEFDALPSFNFGDFGFKIEPELKPNLTNDLIPNTTPESSGDKPEDPFFPKESHRDATLKGYNLQLLDESVESGKWGIPCLDPVNHVPKNLIGFNYAKTSDEFDAGIHFYIDDYQFERLWNRPESYVEILSRFDCLLTPDFSLYLNMPMAMQVWNIYRSRLLGRFWQDEGLTVIPTVSWSTPESYDFCFEGLPKGGTISISTIGVKQSEQSHKIWTDGVDELLRRVKPKTVLLYGGDIGYKFGSKIKVVEFKNSVTERMKGCYN